MGDGFTIPAELLETFNGEALETKIAVSAMLCTVDAEGWPHTAFLSVGELLLGSQSRIQMILWPAATTVRNLERARRGTILAVADGAVGELRFGLNDMFAGDDVGTLIDGRVTAVRKHGAPYAEVAGLIGFRLHDEPGTIIRWRNQIALLRKWNPAPLSRGSREGGAGT